MRTAYLEDGDPTNPSLILALVSVNSTKTQRTWEEGANLRLEACGKASRDLIHIFSEFFGEEIMGVAGRFGGGRRRNGGVVFTGGRRRRKKKRN
jgi:hypothetical protein